ncbi:tRNA 2-thiouridine(34) synthase MnmA [Candidatus Peregrinibacteria bacterium]|jgi:tRNA (5-methylaminomethyl-2-thiouridylate)-methyltransferase|nr:tRNA 2-thiouridine(34) synthase MnmA [Candidatus Peregrinibacteria bacterium]MBT7736773.1 tRNA 2-thiouridine(34) synthase MnmA [Candidatus Peregrinibacteria bacterium]
MKIAVLVSGGVDSAVALRLLHEQGHDVTAFYLKIWLEDELSFLGDHCPWEEDLGYVRQICEEIDIELKVVPLQKEYFETVVQYAINEVKEGRTPNPDVMCNNNIKFGLFADNIDDSYDKIASGHYAQIEEENGTFYLKRTPDPIKDQTYFLCNLKQDQLSRIIFPLGNMTKKEVRALADKYDLPNKDRKDSQGICFLGKVKYADFIKHYLGTKKGDIIELETEEKLGEHDGFWYHTVGQRKGLNIGGRKGSNGNPLYVVKKDTEKNIIYVSDKYHDEDKSRDTVKLTNFNWFSGKAPEKGKLQVKLRHGEHIYNCDFALEDKDHATIKLDSQDQGIAAGQFAAIYDNERCLGCGVIY